MKHYFVAPSLVILAILAGCSGNESSVSDSKITSRLDSLLGQHEFFRLDDLLNKSQDKLSKQDRMVYQVFVDNAFNKVTGSNQLIAELLSGDKFKLPDSIAAKLLFIQRDNFLKQYDYKGAYDAGETLVGKYGASMDSLQIKHIRNLDILYGAISTTPAQSVEIKKDLVIKWKRDKAGLMTMPVQSGDAVYDFIFDTRASVSVISKTYADKLKLRIIDSPYEESSGITGHRFQTYPAVADSVVIGDLVIKNVIFQVVPDEILAFPAIGYRIDGIIGFPVIKQWREVRINKDGTMTIPMTTTKSSLRNLVFDESTTVLNVKTDMDTLSFHLDTGANSSILYANFLRRFESDVTTNATKQATELGGVGGVRQSENFVYPAFYVYVTNKKIKLENVQVMNAPTYPGQKYYGNLGQDLLGQFQETILNFEDMYLELR